MAKLKDCPHCNSELIPHEGVNAEFTHCNVCGCCFIADSDGEMRPGHPMCNPQTAELMAQYAVTTDEVKEYDERIKSLTEEVEAKDEQIAELEETHKADLAKATVDYDEKLKEMQSEHQKEAKALEDNIAKLNAEHAEEVKKLKSEHETQLKAAQSQQGK